MENTTVAISLYPPILHCMTGHMGLIEGNELRTLGSADLIGVGSHSCGREDRTERKKPRVL